MKKSLLIFPGLGCYGEGKDAVDLYLRLRVDEELFIQIKGIEVSMAL